MYRLCCSVFVERDNDSLHEPNFDALESILSLQDPDGMMPIVLYRNKFPSYHTVPGQRTVFYTNWIRPLTSSTWKLSNSRSSNVSWNESEWKVHSNDLYKTEL